MGTYFPPLNLSLDADERAVKRAYAAALKQTRPDEDPAAFQALVAARDRALDWVRRRGQMAIAAALNEIATHELVGDRHGEPVKDFDDGAAKPEATLVDTVPDSASPPATSAPDEPARPPVVTESPVVLPHNPIPLPPLNRITASRGSAEPGFAAMIRAQQASRQVLSGMAVSLIRDEANGDTLETNGTTPADRWAALITAAEDLDLSGRMALERTIAVELDSVMQQHSAAGLALIDVFARTVLILDRAFRWSQDLRRVVRILGEPSGTHPLVFAIERFGENAVRLRMTPGRFPIIPDGDLSAWFGGADNAGVKAYRKAEKAGHFGFTWSWYAFLSPPAWCVRTGLSLWGVGFALAAIIAVYLLFDPIANVGTANSFITFLVLLSTLRIAAAVSARTLEISALVRIIRRIEAGSLPPLSERRQLIANAHGSKLLNPLAGLCFLLLVDGYCLALVIPALNLRTSLVADMIVVPDRKTQGVTFADRLVAQSYLDHAREIAEELDELARVDRSEPSNPIRSKRIEALQQSFLTLIKTLPIGDYVDDFNQFNREIARLKHRQ
jgi:hypothetical protein